MTGNKELTQTFGEHLTLDGYKGSKEKLDNKNFVLSCLNELVNILEMKKLAEPVIYSAPDNQKKDPGGWSGFVVIAESHISIHTFPARGFLSADVYTCKTGMNTRDIVSFFEDKFEVDEIEVNFIKRGKKYPSYNLD